MEESLIPNYNNHNSKIRRISDEIADFEMMIDYNGPEIGEADKLLMESLILHFKDNTKGIPCCVRVFSTFNISIWDASLPKRNHTFLFAQV